MNANYPPPPEVSCTYCDSCYRYTADSGEPWAKEFASLGIGSCCATTVIREDFKNEGIPQEAVTRFNLTGSFWDYARRVFDEGPDSELGRWYVAEYLKG